MAKLTISDVTLTFGGLNALSRITMTIEPGLITSTPHQAKYITGIESFLKPAHTRSPVWASHEPFKISNCSAV